MWLTRPDPAARAPRQICAVAICAALLLTRPAAGESVGAPIALLTLNGFDPVSYFLGGGPVAGTGRFELTWGGRVWRFASSANREVFRDDPAVYAPRLGGYDAAGILDGRLVDADPMVFAVIGDRLYLFRDAGRRARFLAEPGLAGQAEAAWLGLRDQPDGVPTTPR